MRVTFTCEKCGHELGGYDDWDSFVQDAIHVASDLSYRIDKPISCPNCAKLTYGPLTEEMVAEALCDSAPFSCWSDWTTDEGIEYDKEDFRAMARFVLRLTEVIHRIDPNAGYTEEDWPYWREKLLKLAREP